MSSYVSETPTADPRKVLEHFRAKLAFETDCNDVYRSVEEGKRDFVVLDVRGPKLYAKGHVPSAINLPTGKMTARKMAEWPEDTLFVVYCAGPHCNGTDKAAFRLAELGKRVKVMIGGITGWADEGYDFASVDVAVE